MFVVNIVKCCFAMRLIPSAFVLLYSYFVGYIPFITSLCQYLRSYRHRLVRLDFTGSGTVDFCQWVQGVCMYVGYVPFSKVCRVCRVVLLLDTNIIYLLDLLVEVLTSETVVFFSHLSSSSTPRDSWGTDSLKTDALHQLEIRLACVKLAPHEHAAPLKSPIQEHSRISPFRNTMIISYVTI